MAIITRRRFNAFLAAQLALGGALCGSASANTTPGPTRRLRAAAIQMTPVLGDVQQNLEQAEALIRRALAQGADWVVLPEMFTSAAAFHPRMLDAIQPHDGAPFQMLVELARSGGATIGGSYLARREGNVYNSFVLAFPDGTTVRHDKDSPTYWETCYYTDSEPGDDGVLQTPIGAVGSALCWEFIRSRTARRLKDRINLVVGGSCWWTLPDDADSDSPLRAANLKMLQDAPQRFARMLGVPVIHGSHAGRFEAFFSPDLPDVPYHSAYLGEAMIVDANGQIVARRDKSEGAGIVIADLVLPDQPRAIEPIPERFWIPEEMPEPWKDAWQRWFEPGTRYYETVTLPYVETGVMNEYIPEWML